MAIANRTCVSFCNQPKAHFGLPEYAPGTIMVRYLSSKSTRKFKSSPFLHILVSCGYAPGTIVVNVTWMERGFNAGQTHSSIYPSIFNRLRDILILVRNCHFFVPPLHLTPSLGMFPLEFLEKVWSSEKY